MNAANPYCSRCGSLLESDCDFCPTCGAAKSNAGQVSPPTRDPHSWMQKPTVSTALANSGSLVQTFQPPPQIQYVPYSVPAPPSPTQTSGLPGVVRTMGIIALSLMLVGLIPCLGWINYLNFAFSFVTVVLGILALASANSDSARSSAIIGLALVVVANCVGVFRLILGGGCL
jgi:hypothetical protein